jgi:ribose 5-phosphate isomerase
MRDTQLAKPNPLRKKMAAMAARAWSFEMGIGIGAGSGVVWLRSIVHNRAYSSSIEHIRA